MTYDDGTQAVELYVDYVDVGGGRTASPILYDAGAFRIGTEAGGRAFDGWIDEVRLTDQPLHPDQFMRAIVPDAGTFFVVR